VIAELEDLGYLTKRKRHKGRAVEYALLRLRLELYRDGVICSGDLSGDLSQLDTPRVEQRRDSGGADSKINVTAAQLGAEAGVSAHLRENT